MWLLSMLAGCWYVLPNNGGGMVDEPVSRQLDATDVALPEGFDIQVVARGLTFPTAVTFDDEGRLYVLEAGYSYGEVFLTPRIVRVDDGELVTVVAGEHPPWNGFVWHDGAFVVAQGGQVGGGRIARVGLDGTTEVLVDGLPSLGDHHTNGPAIGPDGQVYFGQGTATNAAVVGPDNAEFGWLHRHPEFHDVPCDDITLAGVDFRSENPLDPDSDEEVWTGAYVPFGTPTEPGQVIEGDVRCSGAILRVPAEGGEPEVVAWGLRNPFGLAFAPDGRLFVTENSYDVRGSRPIFGPADQLYAIEEGAWYGWPDFAGTWPVDDDRWKAPGADEPRRVLAQIPSQPPPPLARFAGHSSANGLDFSSDPDFGGGSTAYVALFGDMAPGVGKVLKPAGFRVVAVDVDSGLVTDFVANQGRSNGPASWIDEDHGGLERPVSVRFGPDGALYVVDFGIMTMSEEGPEPRKETGVIWRVAPEGRPLAGGAR